MQQSTHLKGGSFWIEILSSSLAHTYTSIADLCRPLFTDPSPIVTVRRMHSIQKSSLAGESWSAVERDRALRMGLLRDTRECRPPENKDVLALYLAASQASQQVIVVAGVHADAHMGMIFGSRPDHGWTTCIQNLESEMEKFLCRAGRVTK